MTKEEKELGYLYRQLWSWNRGQYYFDFDNYYINPKTVTADLIPLDNGGYDADGQYFGVGQKLYLLFCPETDKYTYCRASDRSDLRRKLQLVGLNYAND